MDPGMPTSSREDDDLSKPYRSAILFATFSLIFSLLIFPPMLWHSSNRNIGATALILWLIVLNLQDFINAIIWSHDDTTRWFQGYVLCDIEVKIISAAALGVPSSVACILRALARVMDTERASLGLSKGHKRREYAIDLLWCAGLPALQMPFHYFVQPSRYIILGISGCSPSADLSWVADLLLYAPPIVWVLVGGYYAALVIVRLHRYRRNFTTLLANSNTNRSRFVRLFAICIAWLVISIPLQVFVISRQVANPHVPFSWARVHDPKAWVPIEMLPSYGRILYTRYIWLAGAFMVFLFFGFGRDASRMYAKGLRAIGLDRCLPCLKADHMPARGASQSGTINSVSSRAKMLFARKDSSTSQSMKSWATDSRLSKGTSSSMAEPLSPKSMKHLETVQETSRNPTAPAPVATVFASRQAIRYNAASDVEKNLPATPKSCFQRLMSPFRPAVVSREPAVPMNNIMRTQDVVVQTSLAGHRV